LGHPGPVGSGSGSRPGCRRRRNGGRDRPSGRAPGWGARGRFTGQPRDRDVRRQHRERNREGVTVASKNEMNQIMKQVQQMQADMMATQEKLAAETVEASVGGGVVKAVVTGSGTVESITIDPGAVDPDDVEMLQDLIVAAV